MNSSDIPIEGKIKVVDFIVNKDDGSPTLMIDGLEKLSTRFSAASWVKLPYEDITLQPNKVNQVQMVLTAPKDARPGGRYIATYIEIGQDIDPDSVDSSIAATKSRVVGLVYIRVAGPITESAQIRKLEVPAFVEYGPVEVAAEIANKGDYHITPEGQFELYDWFGKKVDQKVIEERNIFPDASRSYATKLGQRLMIGKMKVVFTAAYGEGSQALTQTAYVWAFPYKIAILIAMTIVIVLFLVILIAKLITRRQKKLEKKLEQQINELEELKKKLADNFKK